MRAALSSSRASAAPASTQPPAASAVVLHATRRCPCAPFSSPAAFPCAAGRVRSVAVHATGKGFGAPKPKPAVAKKEAGVKAKLLDPSAKCPCGSGSSYEGCCRPFHAGGAAQTPEQLLRSRYAAYYVRNADYIADTTHKDAPEYKMTRSAYLKSVEKTQRRMALVGLKVLEQKAGANADEHYITFKTSFYDNEDSERLLQVREETSRFIRDNNRWFFVESKFKDKLASEAK